LARPVGEQQLPATSSEANILISNHYVLIHK